MVGISPKQIMSERRDVIDLAWPVLVELMLSSLFSMVDMMMLGNIANPDLSAAAVAAVGITNQPMFLGISLIQSLNIGATAMIARYLGAKQEERISPAMKHVLILGFGFLTVPFVILTIMFARPIMSFMGAEPFVVDYSLGYFRILMFGFLFRGITFAFTAAMRGVGETKAPMRINLIANGLNVIGNYLLIYGPGPFPELQVTGAGISTTLSNFVAMVLMWIYLSKGKSRITFKLKEPFRFDRRIMSNLVRIGVPASGESLAMRLGLILFVRIVAGLGTNVYAAHQIALSILSLSFNPGQSFGIVASSLVGRALGEQDAKKADRYALYSRRYGAIISGGMAVLFFFFASPLASLYNNNLIVIANAAMVLQIIAFIQPMQSSQLVLSGALRGAGDTTFPMITTLIGIVFIRVGLALVFVNILDWGLRGAWYAVAIDQLVRWGLITWRFHSGKWKYVKIR